MEGRGPVVLSLIIIGDFGIGKTSLLMRICDGTFDPAGSSTIGLEAKDREVTTDKGEKVTLNIKDTAGQERFAGITCSNFRGVGGVILAFDITDKKSFQSLSESWINEVRRYAGDRVKLCLVGMKSDLAGERKVEESEARAFSDSLASNHNGPSGGTGGSGGICIPYMEVSSKEGTNVEELFVSLASAMRNDRGSKVALGGSSNNVSASRSGTLNLAEPKPAKAKGGRCLI